MNANGQKIPLYVWVAVLVLNAALFYFSVSFFNGTFSISDSSRILSWPITYAVLAGFVAFSIIPIFISRSHVRVVKDIGWLLPFCGLCAEAYFVYDALTCTESFCGIGDFLLAMLIAPAIVEYGLFYILGSFTKTHNLKELVLSRETWVMGVFILLAILIFAALFIVGKVA